MAKEYPDAHSRAGRGRHKEARPTEPSKLVRGIKPNIQAPRGKDRVRGKRRQAYANRGRNREQAAPHARASPVGTKARLTKGGGGARDCAADARDQLCQQHASELCVGAWRTGDQRTDRDLPQDHALKREPLRPAAAEPEPFVPHRRPEGCWVGGRLPVAHVVLLSCRRSTAVGAIPSGRRGRP